MAHKSEPACRCCNCTEHNACEEGCAWVKVEPGSPPLCSACSGTAADLSETLKRAGSARMRAAASNPDKSWGGR